MWIIAGIILVASGGAVVFIWRSKKDKDKNKNKDAARLDFEIGPVKQQ